MELMLGEVLDKQKLFDQYHNHLIQLPKDSYPHWKGRFIQKNPLDLWTYIELIHRVKPDVIIETGTYEGGSATFFSDIQQSINTRGSVLTIDKQEPTKKLDNIHIFQLIGRSQDPKIVNKVVKFCFPDESVMVSLDAGHSTEEVFTELVIYSPLVTLGSYIVVEDTHVGQDNYGKGISGPKEAVDMFLNSTDKFIADKYCERFGVTYNPGGWLKRVK